MNHVESEEMLWAANEGPTAAEIERLVSHNKAKSSFKTGSRIVNPFKQDRKKMGTGSMMMTINGKIRQNDKSNI